MNLKCEEGCDCNFCMAELRAYVADLMYDEIREEGFTCLKMP